MDYYNYEMIIKTKQQEIERLSKEAWKYSYVGQDSFITRMVRKFTAVSRVNKKNQCVCICDC